MKPETLEQLESEMSWNRKASDLDGSAPADDESAVVLPTQATGVHVRPQTHVIPQHVCDPLFRTDVIDFNSLKDTREEKNKTHKTFYTFSNILRIEACDRALTTLLAQAMRLALHWMLVMEPSPSWRTDVFQRFNQFLSYSSSWGRQQEDIECHTACSCAARPTEGSRWIEHYTGAASQERRLIGKHPSTYKLKLQATF